MRVLVVHNRYRSEMPSGENSVVDDDVAALRGSGVEVATFFRHSDLIETSTVRQRAALAVSATYSREAAHDFGRTLAAFQPHLVHLHNHLPLISPWVVRVAARRGVPVVQTVHNYRHSCPSSTSFFRDGRICEDCVGKRLPWPGVMHSCYRGSRAQSLAVVISSGVHRTTWQLVDRFLPVSEFVGHHLELAGIPAERITVRPNATPSRGPAVAPGRGFAFVGRLTEEKGVDLLLAAWRRAELWPTHQLTVVGDGPHRDLVVDAAPRNVRYLGLQDAAGVRRALDEARVVVLPSRCYEGFPRLLAEAFERGRPVVATSVGALGDWVTPDVGWLSAATPDALAAALRASAAAPDIGHRASRARAVYEARLTAETSLRVLLDVYGEVSSAARRGGQYSAGPAA